MFDSPEEHEGILGLGVVATVPKPVELDRLPESLPAGLPEMEPGALLGTVLASIDRDRLNGEDQVNLMQAWNRQLAHAQAELYASMAAVAEAETTAYPDEDPFNVNDAASSEIRAALTLTRRSADYHLGFALQLIDDYPTLWNALQRGHVDLPKTRVIINQTSHLDRKIADDVTGKALERAHRQTTGQLRARLQKLAIAVDPDAARRRYEEGVAQRRVTAEATESGTANVLGLDLPTADSTSAMRRINRLALELKAAGDARTMDQIRADIFLDLLNGRHEHLKSGDRGVVDIRVDLTTLAELDDDAAEIPGWGPVIADIARQAIEEQDDAEWRFTVTDPVNGQIVQGGTTRRRPTAAQRRGIRGPLPDVRLPHLPDAVSGLRHRPPATVVRGWSHRRPQPGTPLPSRPRSEAQRVARGDGGRRHLRLDQPARSHLCSRGGTSIEARSHHNLRNKDEAAGRRIRTITRCGAATKLCWPSTYCFMPRPAPRLSSTRGRGLQGYPD